MEALIEDETVAPEAPGDVLDAEPQLTEAAPRTLQAEAARARAAQLITDRKYADARNALEEAERLEQGPSRWRAEASRMVTSIRSRLPAQQESSQAAPPEAVTGTQSVAGPLASAKKVVSLYSKVAVVARILPGGRH